MSSTRSDTKKISGAEIDRALDVIQKLTKRVQDLEGGLIQIIQMERYPNESGSQDYDGIYPTGAFALKVLNGTWPDERR